MSSNPSGTELISSFNSDLSNKAEGQQRRKKEPNSDNPSSLNKVPETKTSHHEAKPPATTISKSKISSNGQGGTPTSRQETHPTEPESGYFDGSVVTCRDVILTLLREEGIEDQLPYYAIYMVGSDGLEHALKMDERPGDILEWWHAAGTDTKLIVRSSMPDEVTDL